MTVSRDGDSRRAVPEEGTPNGIPPRWALIIVVAGAVGLLVGAATGLAAGLTAASGGAAAVMVGVATGLAAGLTATGGAAATLHKMIA